MVPHFRQYHDTTRAHCISMNALKACGLPDYLQPERVFIYMGVRMNHHKCNSCYHGPWTDICVGAIVSN